MIDNGWVLFVVSKFVMIFVVFVVLVSGCTELGGDFASSFAMGDGLQINSFEFKPTRLVSGQATILKLELQNMGSVNIGNVFVYLYGLSEEWYDGSSMIGDVVASDLKKFDIGSSLRAADPELKTEGDKRVVVWKLNSPEELMEGTEFVHKAYARVCYPYKTSAIATVEVIGEDEWLVMEQTGKYSQYPIKVEQSAGPIQISIESMQPVIASNGINMELKISNVGEGIAFAGQVYDCSQIFDSDTLDVSEHLNNVKFEFGGGGSMSCSVNGVVDGIIPLLRGQEKKITITCDGLTSTMPKQEINMDIEVTYNYYIDSETSVVILGKLGD